MMIAGDGNGQNAAGDAERRTAGHHGQQDDHGVQPEGTAVHQGRQDVVVELLEQDHGDGHDDGGGGARRGQRDEHGDDTGQDGAGHDVVARAAQRPIDDVAQVGADASDRFPIDVEGTVLDDPFLDVVDGLGNRRADVLELSGDRDTDQRRRAGEQDQEHQQRQPPGETAVKAAASRASTDGSGCGRAG